MSVDRHDHLALELRRLCHRTAAVVGIEALGDALGARGELTSQAAR